MKILPGMSRAQILSMLAATAFLLCLSAASHAAEMCKEPKLQSLPANHPECLFYAGTARYRAKDYATAAQRWQALIGLKSVAIEDEHLRVDAYNNLGFLYYTGRGVQPDRGRAIGYWRLAMDKGNEEAVYHLCHAYDDKAGPEYNPKLALGYCKEALRRYGQLKDQDDGSMEIVRQIRKSISTLEGRPGPDGN